MLRACPWLQMIIPPTKVFLADMPIKQLSGTDEYFDRLGWGELPQVSQLFAIDAQS